MPVNEYLVKYVRQMRQNGAKDEKIKQVLLEQDYSESEILGALWHDINKAKDEMEKPKSKAWLYNILLLIVILLLVGTALYLRVWNPPWNPFPQTAPIILELSPF